MMDIHVFYQDEQIYSSTGKKFAPASYFLIPLDFKTRKITLYGNTFDFEFVPSTVFWISQFNFTRWIVMARPPQD